MLVRLGRLVGVLVLSTLMVGIWATEADSPAAMRHVRRLADELAVAMGRQTPVYRVADVMRTALPGEVSVAMIPVTPKGLASYPPNTKFELEHPNVRTAVALPDVSGISFAPLDDGVEVSFRCPARLLGRPAVLTIEQSAAGTRTAQPFSCPDSPEALARVRLPPIDGSKTVTYVRGLESERVETQPLELTRGARLRVALGLVPVPEGDVPGAARFRVTADAGDGRTMTVLDRRLDPHLRANDAAWVPVAVDLDPVLEELGSNVRLVFEVSTDTPSSPAWGNPTLTWVTPSRTPPRAVNVVLISIDTLRADQLGVYGARRRTSPAIDALARESTVFDRVVAPAPWTLPSHVSMMTGLYSCAHGMVGPSVGRSLPTSVVPLAEHLRNAGYDTAAITEDAFIDPAAFLRGFGYYWENGAGDDRVRGTVAQAERWLRTEATEPFFLFLHTYQAHDPYFSPPKYVGLLGPAPGRVGSGDPEPRKLEKYDAAVRYTDDALAPLLSALRRSSYGERTLVVLTSDHGESFGEHGYTGHGRGLEEEVLRVPLIVWGRELVAPRRRVSGLVSLVDVMPTILDVLHLPTSVGIDGTSLAAQIRPADVSPAMPDRVLFSENTLSGVRRLSARYSRWKAVWENDALRIFDLVSDPGERVSVATSGLASAAAVLRRQFEAQCARQKAALASAAPEGESQGLIDPERERHLKALGYLR